MDSRRPYRFLKDGSRFSRALEEAGKLYKSNAKPKELSSTVLENRYGVWGKRRTGELPGWMRAQ